MTPMHPLAERLIDPARANALTAANAADWAARPGEHVLFFSGDPVRFPEAADVAVVLPELQAAFVGRFDVGVVLRADEDAVARRWGVQHWPSLVFVRDGGWLGTVSGMQDWGEFVAAVAAVLQKTPGRAPGIGIPVMAAAAPSCH